MYDQNAIILQSEESIQQGRVLILENLQYGILEKLYSILRHSLKISII